LYTGSAPSVGPPEGEARERYNACDPVSRRRVRLQA